jgi:hypothetical protein
MRLMKKRSELHLNHDYYVLVYPTPTLKQRLFSVILMSYAFMDWIVAFVVGFFNLTWTKQSLPTHDFKLANHHLTLIDVQPKIQHKALFGFLAKFHETVFPLPFASYFLQPKLFLDNPADKAFVDQILSNMDRMNHQNPLNFKFIYLKGMEIFDNALHAYFLEALYKKYGPDVFAPKEHPFHFFSVETAHGAILDSLEFMPASERDKPMKSRTFTLISPKPHQNYVDSLCDVQRIATKQKSTVVTFNHPGTGNSNGQIWSKHDCHAHVLAQIERLVLLGVSRNNIHIEGYLASDVVIPSNFVTTLTSPTPYPPKHAVQRPMIVASSGGGGHISAALGLIDTLRDKATLQKYEAQLHHDHSFSFLRSSTRASILFMSIPYVRAAIQFINALFEYPTLPHYPEVKHEINRLEQAEIAPLSRPAKGRQREYLDMILDAQPSGYEAAAIFNTLQRNDKIIEIERLVQLQEFNDALNYPTVYRYFLNKLKAAAESGQPFSEVISTQAQSLEALCDAVIDYNAHVIPHLNKKGHALQPICIHQYFTDLPTRGATHFFDPLMRLSPKQKQHMEIHAVNITQPIFASYFDHGHGFKKIHNIAPRNNPMVRAGFYNPKLSQHYLNPEIPMTLPYKTSESMAQRLIPAQSLVASIMLGSLSSHATAEYVRALLNQGYDTIFVFGGLVPDIDQRINAIIDAYPRAQQDTIRQRIVRLGNQSDHEIAPIMTRSHCVIIRGGGLSTMEQMALPQRPNKAILIHQQDGLEAASPLCSGLSWEDGNVTCLLDHLTNQGLFAQKTSLKRIQQTLSDAHRFIQRPHAASSTQPQEWLAIKPYQQLSKQQHSARVSLFAKPSTRNASNHPCAEENHAYRPQ